MADYDFAIIGGGIVGLATAHALSERFPRRSLVVLEKEPRLAAHQTGRNSGVIHSGIYYKPGSLKARYARAGNASMRQFCSTHGIAHEICGKLIVATRTAELPRLRELQARAGHNGLEVEWLEPPALAEIEPQARGLAALRVPAAGIVDYTQVCQALARLVGEQGGEIRLDSRVERIAARDDAVEIAAGPMRIRARWLVNCAGLHSDRIARLAGVDAGVQIVPFRGEYYQLRPAARQLVRHLIYPVPDPAFPFLGVHFTRMIDGAVEAGPNAVLAFAREGYRRLDIDLHDLAEVLASAGFRTLARRHWRQGLAEMWRSWSKPAFVHSLQQLVPAIRAADLETGIPGIRAQALKRDGSLVDDFHIVRGRRSIHVCNAPSPAATASLEIGRHVAGLIEDP